MDWFITSNPSSSGEMTWNTAVGLTASQYVIQQDGIGKRILPAKISIYPADAYDDLTKRVTYNIFRFTKSKGEFQVNHIFVVFVICTRQSIK